MHLHLLFHIPILACFITKFGRNLRATALHKGKIFNPDRNSSLPLSIQFRVVQGISKSSSRACVFPISWSEKS